MPNLDREWTRTRTANRHKLRRSEEETTADTRRCTQIGFGQGELPTQLNLTRVLDSPLLRSRSRHYTRAPWLGDRTGAAQHWAPELA
jgi:hypothetical protein